MPKHPWIKTAVAGRVAAVILATKEKDQLDRCGVGLSVIGCWLTHRGVPRREGLAC